MSHVHVFHRSADTKPDLEKETSPWVHTPNTESLLRLPCEYEYESRQAGQDVALTMCISKEDGEYLFTVADGHGNNGDHHAYVATRLLVRQGLDCLPALRAALSAQDQRLISDLVQQMYEHTQETMRNHHLFPTLLYSGGTTMSITFVLRCGSRRYLIGTNVGDSPILWSPTEGVVKELSTDHSCDNLDAVEQYLRHCRHAGLPPKPVVYGRINCPNGTRSNHPAFCDTNGVPQPIPVWRYYGTQVALNRENYQTLVAMGVPVGKQSVREPPTYIRPDGLRSACTGHEHENWGSTLAGGPQNLKALGDFHTDGHLSSVPDVTIKDITDGGQLLMMSDGMSDPFQWEDLMDWFWLNDNVYTFYQHLFQTAERLDDQYHSRVVNGLRHPTWDDVSGIFVKFEPLPDSEALVYPPNASPTSTVDPRKERFKL